MSQTPAAQAAPSLTGAWRLVETRQRLTDGSTCAAPPERAVTVLEVLLALAFAAISAWLLWRAVTRGEVVGQLGAFTRADAPIGFWLAMSLNTLALAVFGAAALVLAWRALVPAPLAQRESALYPTRARRYNVSGLVVLRCSVTQTFGVKDCSVTSETPPGLGFGASALQVSALYVLPQKDRARARPGQPINLPIRFKMPTPTPHRLLHRLLHRPPSPH